LGDRFKFTPRLISLTVQCRALCFNGSDMFGHLVERGFFLRDRFFGIRLLRFQSGGIGFLIRLAGANTIRLSIQSFQRLQGIGRKRAFPLTIGGNLLQARFQCL